ncbi:hypothetical protein [Stenotrophomonas acidaminiphila]|jgi:hypothetical protein|uniref:hypothetical protein n=1 Tax=Stenotrophomonas acidaminiphila TaxID=128780 RepID=UPI0020C6B9C9|nr:hypothetical protein [Stenotrophomonas acidaminiphila]
MNAPILPTADQLARSNRLGALCDERDAHAKAGNNDQAALYSAAANRRLELIEAGEVPVGGVA